MTSLEKLQRCFPSGNIHKVIGVLHCFSASGKTNREIEKLVGIEIQKLIDAGFDGMCLINQPCSLEELMLYAKAAKNYVESKKLTNFGLGMNLLGYSTIISMHFAKNMGFDLVWSDISHIDDGPSPNRTATLSAIQNVRSDNIFYASGVHFKVGLTSKTIEESVRDAVFLLDGLTTSGPATGHPPTLDKIQAFRKAAPNHAIGIASGVAPDNIKSFSEYANYFLVASSITVLEPGKDSILDSFDPKKCRALIRSLR